MRRARISRTDPIAWTMYCPCFFLIFLFGVLQQALLPFTWLSESEVSTVILLNAGTLLAAYLVSGSPQGLVLLPVFSAFFGTVTESTARHLVHMASYPGGHALRGFLFLAVNVPSYFIISQQGMLASKRRHCFSRSTEVWHDGRSLILSSAFLLFGLFSAGLCCFAE